jgi:hypothetical protein
VAIDFRSFFPTKGFRCIRFFFVLVYLCFFWGDSPWIFFGPFLTKYLSAGEDAAVPSLRNWEPETGGDICPSPRRSYNKSEG